MSKWNRLLFLALIAALTTGAIALWSSNRDLQAQVRP
jgi:hypothetical protein